MAQSMTFWKMILALFFLLLAAPLYAATEQEVTATCNDPLQTLYNPEFCVWWKSDYRDDDALHESCMKMERWENSPVCQFSVPHANFWRSIRTVPEGSPDIPVVAPDIGNAINDFTNVIAEHNYKREKAAQNTPVKKEAGPNNSAFVSYCNFVAWFTDGWGLKTVIFSTVLLCLAVLLGKVSLRRSITIAITIIGIVIAINSLNDLTLEDCDATIKEKPPIAGPF